ncbi:TetR family transcriptional regulator [Burkholderia ambifaria]
MVRKTKRSALLTRESILDAGERLFIEHGFQAVTLDDIAKSATVTRGAVYWHFSSKSDLLREIFVRLQRGLRQDLLELAQCASSAEASRNVTRFCRMTLTDGRMKLGDGTSIGWWIANYGVFLEDPDTAFLVGELFQEMHEALSAVIKKSRADQDGIDSKARRAPETDAFMLQALLVGYARLISMQAQPRNIRTTAACMARRAAETMNS